MAKFKTWDKAIELPLDVIEPDPRNPNVMSEDKFTRLVERIEEHGFDEPIQVIEHPEKEGKYLIVGGEHRYKSAKLLGLTTIPAVVKETLDDETTRYQELIARNINRGDLDEAKFNKLIDHVNSLNTAPLTPEELSKSMGFCDVKELQKHIRKEKDNTEKAVEKAKEATKSGKNTQIIDNVSYALNEILNKYGDTAPKGYIFFCYKNRMHLIVQCDKDLYQLTHDIAEGLKRDNTEICGCIKDVFEIIKNNGQFPEQKVDFEYQPDTDDGLDDLESPKDLLK